MNVDVRIFPSLPVSIASCERSFSKFKLIKKYLQSSTLQESLSSLSITSLECNIDKNIISGDVINGFTEIKSRKVQLKGI